MAPFLQGRHLTWQHRCLRGGVALSCTRRRTQSASCATHSTLLPCFHQPVSGARMTTVMQSSSARLADDVYMQEYADLKKSLLTTTRQSGAAIAAYLLATTGGATSICALVGMGFSNLYLLWLFRDIDAVSATDYVPMFEAKKIDAPVQRTLAIWVASYYHSLRPRLLVPISLAALMAAWNATADIPLTGLQESGLLLGFLSHKAALLLKVVDAVSPKGYGDQSSRPTIDKLEDDSMVQLDRWGRPKAASFTMPTEALPDDVDPNNPGLLPSLVMRAVEGVDIDSKTSSPNNNEASDVKTTRE